MIPAFLWWVLVYAGESGLLSSVRQEMKFVGVRILFAAWFCPYHLLPAKKILAKSSLKESCKIF